MVREKRYVPGASKTRNGQDRSLQSTTNVIRRRGGYPDFQAVWEEQGFEFPVYYDLEQQGYMAYQTYSIPSTYFLDAEGHAVARANGAIGQEILNEGIRLITEE